MAMRVSGRGRQWIIRGEEVRTRRECWNYNFPAVTRHHSEPDPGALELEQHSLPGVLHPFHSKDYSLCYCFFFFFN